MKFKKKNVNSGQIPKSNMFQMEVKWIKLTNYTKEGLLNTFQDTNAS